MFTCCFEPFDLFAFLRLLELRFESLDVLANFVKVHEEKIGVDLWLLGVKDDTLDIFEDFFQGVTKVLGTNINSGEFGTVLPI